MIIEKAYDFRKKLLTIHEKNIRNFDYVPKENELEIRDGVVIEIGNTDNVVINTAARDFIDFLATSMNVSATFSKKGTERSGNVIRLALAKDEGVDLKEAEGYKGFFINVTDGIEVFGYDDRGVAAALYYLEDLMTFVHAPYIKQGEIRKKPAMAPLMVHSGYGMEEWPDDYLSRIAHEGRDAILVFTTGINQTRHRVFLTLRATVSLIIPTGSQLVEVESTMPIAESIIVGGVPDSFVDVNDSKDILDLIP